MSRRDVLVDLMETRVEVAQVTTDVVVEPVDVETTYFYITSAQTAPEHRVVNDE
jgi:virulence-associated protein VagC